MADKPASYQASPSLRLVSVQQKPHVEQKAIARRFRGVIVCSLERTNDATNHMAKQRTKHAMATKTDKLLTTAEAAEHIGYKPRTLENWRSVGNTDLPYIQVGGRGGKVRYRLSDVEAFLSRHIKTHTS